MTITIDMSPLRGLDALMSTPAVVTIAAIIFTLLIHNFLPHTDRREPPVVKPRVPFIGHIIGLMRHQAKYHIMLQSSTDKPIATLPMLTGKMYAIWDPHLIAAAFRSKSLSTTPHIKVATPAITRVGINTTNLLRGPHGDDLVDRIFEQGIAPSFKGASLQRLNETALSGLATQLSGVAFDKNEDVPNVWLWLRRLMTSVTSTALYGTHDPFAASPDVEDALWELERNLLSLTLNLPAVFTPAGHGARNTLAAALTPYYAARRDEHVSVSDFVRNRAAVLRGAGLPDADIARIEMLLPFAALANTVPLLFWLFSTVVTRPDLVALLRKEVERLVMSRSDANEVTLLVAAGLVEDRCPLLMSCYRETLRQTVHQVSTRTVMEDTTLTDRSGQPYLLKAGHVVQMSVGASHAVPESWGPDADEFQPGRFLSQRGKSSGGDGPGGAKAIRAAFQPFGGGTHLCPGRQFAFAEIMATMATLLLGYEFQPLEGTEWRLPGFGARSVIDAVTKPARHGEGFGMKVRRRQGWEGVRWVYDL
ncbi:cytochrome P450 [Lasiosphaeris hirsuta]|uniref:Cytochrome P450 n=1 Tax=Lasiosphaeris hirsuta TaxID=260670 RepID=A0AA40AIF5_9PEZI|nr:cytochrome P450 [Lasiosphaeris hirsuta]